MRVRVTGFALAAAALAAAACAPASPTGPAPTSPATPLPALCHSTLAVDQTAFAATGGTTFGAVTSSLVSCRWTIAAPAWITVTPTSGTGNLVVTIAVQATTTDARVGHLVINDETVTLLQEGFNPIFTNARCHSPAFAGKSTDGVCTVSARVGLGLTGGVTADLRVFGGSAEHRLQYIISGEWDLNVVVPTGFQPGMVPLTFTATDYLGRTATISASLEVR